MFYLNKEVKITTEIRIPIL